MYRISQSKIRELVNEINTMFQYKPDYNHGEVIVALSEYIGRVIVSAASNRIQADEMQKVVIDHLARTIKVGAEAQDKRIITGV